MFAWQRTARVGQRQGGVHERPELQQQVERQYTSNGARSEGISTEWRVDSLSQVYGPETTVMRLEM